MELASHHRERCLGVVYLCVPYIPDGFALENLLTLIDRVYPESDLPFGQWEYQRFYQEHFDDAVRAYEANVANTVKALFHESVRRERASRVGWRSCGAMVDGLVGGVGSGCAA